MTCNSTGTGWSACNLTECSPDYHFVGTSCVQDACVPGATLSCTGNNGAGIETCNAQGSGYGSCVLNKCTGGFILQNGICVVPTCPAGSIFNSTQGKCVSTYDCTCQYDTQTVTTVTYPGGQQFSTVQATDHVVCPNSIDVTVNFGSANGTCDLSTFPGSNPCLNNIYIEKYAALNGATFTDTSCSYTISSGFPSGAFIFPENDN